MFSSICFGVPCARTGIWPLQMHACCISLAHSYSQVIRLSTPIVSLSLISIQSPGVHNVNQFFPIFAAQSRDTMLIQGAWFCSVEHCTCENEHSVVSDVLRVHLSIFSMLVVVVDLHLVQCSCSAIHVVWLLTIEDADLTTKCRLQAEVQSCCSRSSISCLFPSVY